MNYELVQELIVGYENENQTLPSRTFGKGENRKYHILIREEEAPKGSDLYTVLSQIDNAETKFIPDLYISGNIVNW